MATSSSAIRDRLMQGKYSYAASIVETVQQPLLVLDADLRVQSANQSFYRVFRVAPEESEGRLLAQLGERQWDIVALREQLERILSQHSEVRDYEVDLRFPTIGQRTMLLNARRLRQRGNRPPLILLAMEDITDRKRAENARQLFLAATSHDVLNALHSIIGYAQMLEDTGLTDGVAPRISSLSKALAEIMRDLLDHAHAENDRPSLALVSARALLRERADAIEWRCKEKGLELRVELPAEGSLTTDPVKVTRILDNLLSNAVRYTPSGNVHLQGQLANTALCVTVRDTGIGIPAEDIERVFEHYYRAPTAQRIEPLGSGLGLSTVKRFCDLLGGRAEIESTPGVGTTCTVVLPRHPPSL
jgi:two-component system, chemotaxis family, CheB/CheR fusion protein